MKFGILLFCLLVTTAHAQSTNGAMTSFTSITNLFQTAQPVPTGSMLRQKSLLKATDITYVEKKLTTPQMQGAKCSWSMPEGTLQYTSTENKSVEVFEWKNASNIILTWEVEHPDSYAIWAPMDCAKMQWMDMTLSGRKYFYIYGPGVGPWQEGRAKEWRFAVALALDQLHKPLYIANRNVIQDILGMTVDGTLAFAKTKKISKDIEAEQEWLLSSRVLSEVGTLANSAYVGWSNFNYTIIQNNTQLQYSLDFSNQSIKRVELKRVKEHWEQTEENTYPILSDSKYDLYRKTLLSLNSTISVPTATTIKITGSFNGSTKEWSPELESPVVQNWWQSIEKYCFELKNAKKEPIKENVEDPKREKIVPPSNSI